MKMLRRAHVYLAEGDRPAIVAPVHYNRAGIYYEQSDPLILAQWRGCSGLAAAVHSSLKRFSYRDHNLREHKKTDWPAFRASRCRSVREFESTYLCIVIQAVNDTELFFDMSIQPRGEPDIFLHITISAHALDEEKEQRLVRLFDAAARFDVR